MLSQNESSPNLTQFGFKSINFNGLPGLLYEINNEKDAINVINHLTDTLLKTSEFSVTPGLEETIHNQVMGLNFERIEDKVLITPKVKPKKTSINPSKYHNIAGMNAEIPKIEQKSLGQKIYGFGQFIKENSGNIAKGVGIASFFLAKDWLLNKFTNVRIGTALSEHKNIVPEAINISAYEQIPNLVQTQNTLPNASAFTSDVNLDIEKTRASTPEPLIKIMDYRTRHFPIKEVTTKSNYTIVTHEKGLEIYNTSTHIPFLRKTYANENIEDVLIKGEFAYIIEKQDDNWNLTKLNISCQGNNVSNYGIAEVVKSVEIPAKQNIITDMDNNLLLCGDSPDYIYYDYDLEKTGFTNDVIINYDENSWKIIKTVGNLIIKNIHNQNKIKYAPYNYDCYSQSIISIKQIDDKIFVTYSNYDEIPSSFALFKETDTGIEQIFEQESEQRITQNIEFNDYLLSQKLTVNSDGDINNIEKILLNVDDAQLVYPAISQKDINLIYTKLDNNRAFGANKTHYLMFKINTPERLSPNDITITSVTNEKLDHFHIKTILKKAFEDSFNGTTPLTRNQIEVFAESPEKYDDIKLIHIQDNEISEHNLIKQDNNTLVGRFDRDEVNLKPANIILHGLGDIFNSQIGTSLGEFGLLVEKDGVVYMKRTGAHPQLTNAVDINDALTDTTYGTFHCPLEYIQVTTLDGKSIDEIPNAYIFNGQPKCFFVPLPGDELDKITSLGNDYGNVNGVIWTHNSQGKSCTNITHQIEPGEEYNYEIPGKEYKTPETIDERIIYFGGAIGLGSIPTLLVHRNNRKRKRKQLQLKNVQTTQQQLQAKQVQINNTNKGLQQLTGYENIHYFNNVPDNEFRQPQQIIPQFNQQSPNQRKRN
jgi:hypothetical protein